MFKTCKTGIKNNAAAKGDIFTFPVLLLRKLMMAEKTMAILGDTGEFPSALMEIFAIQDIRLLYVSENEENNVALKNRSNNLKVGSKVEFLSCEREVCWEADIIAITGKENISPALVQKLNHYGLKYHRFLNLTKVSST